MRRSPVIRPKTIAINYEMIEAARLMSFRNKSTAMNPRGGMPLNRSDALYRQAFKGNGVNYLLSARSLKSCWMVTLSTTGVDYETGLTTIKPHVMSFEIKERCSLSTAVFAVSSYWSKCLAQDMAELKLDPKRIDVAIRSIS